MREDDDDRDDGRQQQDDEQQLSEDTMTNTLALWESVEKTDPAHTKGFQKGGGFSGTAINAVYLARRATETFGPIGTGWGVEVVDEAYIDGAPIMDKDGNVLCREVIHKVRVKLWYMRDGKRGEVEHYGLTTFVGKNKYGPFTDEDHAKKSLTDATTKALSLLGFAADVHLGRFDDNKYVNDLRREFSARNDDGNAATGRSGGRGSSPAEHDKDRIIRDTADACIALHAAAVQQHDKTGDTSGFWELHRAASRIEGEDRMLLWEMLSKHSAVRAAIKEYAGYAAAERKVSA